MVKANLKEIADKPIKTWNVSDLYTVPIKSRVII
jgi:hypothetical protein